MKKVPGVKRMTILEKKLKKGISRRPKILFIIVAVVSIFTLFYFVHLKLEYNTEPLFSNQYDGSGDWSNMRFSSKGTVEQLKIIYNKIEYFDGFKAADPDDNDYYTKKYTQLLKSEVEYYNTQYKLYTDLSTDGYSVDNIKRGDYISCLMFDMDEDGKPELCFTGNRGAYVFKYKPELDQYSTWWEAYTSNYHMMGSRKVRTLDLDGGHWFYQLSKSGDEECMVYFGEFMDDDYELLYLVSLPVYKEGFRDEITEEMQADGYYDDWYYQDGRGRCFFRVTKEEYLEITDKFLKACRRAYDEAENYVFEPKFD